MTQRMRTYDGYPKSRASVSDGFCPESGVPVDECVGCKSDPVVVAVRPLDSNTIRAIMRQSKAQLADRIEQWAQQRRQQWIIGGPSTWSKDELVSACVRIEQGQEP